MKTRGKNFDDNLADFIDGVATPEEVSSLFKQMASNPDRIHDYLDMTEIEAMLRCSRGHVTNAIEANTRKRDSHTLSKVAAGVMGLVFLAVAGSIGFVRSHHLSYTLAEGARTPAPVIQKEAVAAVIRPVVAAQGPVAPLASITNRVSTKVDVLSCLTGKSLASITNRVSTKEVNTMKQKTTACLAAAALLSGALPAVAGSNRIRLNADYKDSLQWWTVLSTNNEVNWVWPVGARSAKLTISGAGNPRSETINRVSERLTASHAWTVEMPVKESSENVYSLSLVFYAQTDAAGNPLAGAALAADGLGLVRGVRGAATHLYGVGTKNDSWGKVCGPTAVLPIPADSTGLAINNQAQAFTHAPGWYLWKNITAKQNYALVLFIGDLAYSVSLTGISQGTIFYFLN